ncbi:unnamed protein product, partial [Heterotrigona itama]
NMNTLMRKIVISLNKLPIIKKHASIQLTIVSNFHNNDILLTKNEPNIDITPHHFNVQVKVKKTFLEIIRIYKRNDVNRKGQLEFIQTALKYMNEFGVHQDIEAYKALLDIFPRGRYVPENKFQIMLYHYPKHQDTALRILNKMEENFVIPDYDVQKMILEIFGKNGLVMKKCFSMFYWLPKFSQLNPWPIPRPTPTDAKVLAEYALKKISSIDVQANITLYKTKDVPDAIDDTWILSSMSKSQQELLAVQPTDKSLMVEGPFSIWVAEYYLNYFVLKGDPIKREVIYGEYDDVSNMKIPFWERHNFKIPVTIHEQDDGVYYAMCASGTSSKDSLLSWIRCLQKTNPILKKIPVVFKLRSLTNEQLCIDDDAKKQISQNADADTTEK